MPNQRLKYLFDQYIQDSCTPAEKRELAALALAAQRENDVKELLGEYWDKLSATMQLPEEKAERIATRILQQSPSTNSFRPVKLRTIAWRRIAVAASILLVLGLGSYFAFFNKAGHSGPDPESISKVDVPAPATNRAQITLADGRVVYLDSAANGELVQQGNVKLVKLANGQIAYQTASGEIIKEIQNNTLSNPRGSKVINMTLSDGSRVWLNAGSSVKYPVAFIGNDRKVEITGEAYFSVTHNEKMPFKVKANAVVIEDLGTEFNVNAYTDQAGTKTTLIDGVVKIGAITLKPGQQAINDKLGAEVDIEEVIAWKNGKFLFNDASIETIMKEVGRWYDAEIVYEGKIPGNFVAGISRDVPVSKLLHILELTNRVHFKIEGKKIIVSK